MWVRGGLTFRHGGSTVPRGVMLSQSKGRVESGRVERGLSKDGPGPAAARSRLAAARAPAGGEPSKVEARPGPRCLVTFAKHVLP